MNPIAELIAEKNAALAKCPQWISVEAQKPAPDVVVLVAVKSWRSVEREDGGKDEQVFYTVTEGQYTERRHGGYMEVYQGQIGDGDDVTHWMPLPAPPEAA